MKRIINGLRLNLKSDFALKTVKQLRREGNNYYLDDLDDRFDDLTIEQLLLLYKINKLEDKEIITYDVADNLRELYYMLLSTEVLIGKEILKEMNEVEYDSELVTQLHNRCKIILETLKRYNLIPEDIDIDLIIDTSIDNEIYPKKEDEKLNSLVMSLRYI